MKSPWWEKHSENMKEATSKFGSLEEAVIYAQTVCPFDHRAEWNPAIINMSLGVLMSEFGEVPDIEDSKYSWKPSVHDGYSDMFLMHLYFYMRIMNNLKPKRILEIGGGYGETARIFLTLNPDIEYHIIDLEESLFFSRAYLSLNEVTYKKDNINSRVFYWMSNHFNPLKGEKFDLVINTVSCQEMPPETVQEYIRFIENDIDVDYLYWLNYKGNDPRHAELSFDEAPPIDDNWTTIFERTNPNLMRITSPRNFLELLLRRSKKE